MSLPITHTATSNRTANAARRGDTVSADELKSRRIAQEFEAILLSQLTSTMNSTIGDDEEGDGNMMSGDSAHIYQQMFGEQMASAVSQNGGIGLADMMLEKIKTQNTAQPEIARAIAAARYVRDSTAASTAGAVKAETLKSTNLNFENSKSENLKSEISNLKFSNSEIVAPATPSSISPLSPATLTRPRRVTSVPSADFSSAAPQAAQLPVRGRISSLFGERRDPITGAHKFHQGVDIAAPKNSPIGAYAAGTVVFAGRQGGYGNTVVIEHGDGRLTRYAHAERLMVTEGEKVMAGQTIATVGSTGHSTGPHLHFEISAGGRKIDPLRALANENAQARR